MDAVADAGSHPTLRWRKPDSNRWSHFRSARPPHRPDVAASIRVALLYLKYQGIDPAMLTPMSWRCGAVATWADPEELAAGPFCTVALTVAPVQSGSATTK